MTTLRLPTPDELEPDDRQVLETVASMTNRCEF